MPEDFRRRLAHPNITTDTPVGDVVHQFVPLAQPQGPLRDVVADAGDFYTSNLHPLQKSDKLRMQAVQFEIGVIELARIAVHTQPPPQLGGAELSETATFVDRHDGLVRKATTVRSSERRAVQELKRAVTNLG